MKILILSYYHPWISGGGHRPVCFLEQDLIKGNDVVFLFESNSEMEHMENFPLFYSPNLKLVRKLQNRDELVPINPQAADIVSVDYLLETWRPDYVRSHNPVQDYIELIRQCTQLNIPHLYDQMDYWDGFPVQPWGENAEEPYISDATACITISNWLIEKNKETYSKLFHVIPNGLKESFLQKLYRPYAEIKEKAAHQRKNVLYVGAIWPEWFDWDIVEYIVLNRPEYDFTFVGAYSPNDDEDDGRNVKAIVSRMQAYKNVRFTGQLVHSELISYLKDADVGIIPFVVNEVTEACSPLKCFEYLAAFLPVVATNLPEIHNYPNVYIATSRELFLRMIDDASKKIIDQSTYNKVQLFNEGNTWRTRSNQLDDIVLKECIK